MKKICKGCGKNRLIGKFGQQSRMRDGKNPYCRDCMRTYNKRYRRSSKGCTTQRDCVLKYKEKNKEKIKEYNRQYYIKNKTRILYNKKCREETECVMIFDDEPRVKKINKVRKVNPIVVIDPKRK